VKKFLSVLIIIFILGSNITIYADENNSNNINKEVVEFNLQDYYKYNDSKLGIETYSSQKSEIKEAIYNGLVNLKDKINITSYISDVNNDNESINEILSLYFDVLNEHPEIFYSENSIMVGYSYNTSTNKITYIEFLVSYLYDEDTINSMKNRLNEKIDYIQNNYLNGVTDKLEQEYIIHDYIVNNTTYDYENYNNNTIPHESYTVYGALVNGVAVCEGYSKAALLLFNKVGIEAGIVTSSAMNHAWNYVNIDNQYYHVDLTWDDPVPETNRIRYNYFNLTNIEMLRDHYGWNDNLYPSFSEASISSLRELVVNQGSNIARVNDRLYYIDGEMLYSTDLYGKNKKSEGSVGYGYMPIPYKNSIIFIDKSNINDVVKIYDLSLKSTSTLYEANGTVSQIYTKDDILYIKTEDGLKDIKLNIEGDLNNDGIIDITDIALMATKYNLTSTSPDWNKDYDLNNDNIIDIFDLVMLSREIE
jgi:hypothetical protein